MASRELKFGSESMGKNTQKTKTSEKHGQRADSRASRQSYQQANSQFAPSKSGHAFAAKKSLAAEEGSF